MGESPSTAPIPVVCHLRLPGVGARQPERKQHGEQLRAVGCSV